MKSLPTLKKVKSPKKKFMRLFNVRADVEHACNSVFDHLPKSNKLATTSKHPIVLNRSRASH